MEIGEKIKQARKATNLSQKELGQRLGVSQAMIGQYESGKRVPKLETLKKIASALDTPIWTLLDMNKQEAILSYNEYTGASSFHTPYEMSELYELIKEDILSENNFKKITKAYKKLNAKGKYKALQQVELLTRIPEYRKEEK